VSEWKRYCYYIIRIMPTDIIKLEDLGVKEKEEEEEEDA
jgi:hypothetical protein